MAHPNLDRALASCEANRQRDLDDLFRLIRQPSISTQNIGVAECAALVEELLATAGFAVTSYPTAGHPMIYGERCNAPGKPTVLIYGHYDVQPPEPLDRWDSPPFEPEIRDGRIWARGAGDNKGQFFAQICGARAWLETAGELPVNVKFLIEGEEENGSPHLDQFVAEHGDLLAADLVYTSDGPVLDDNHPEIVFGVRGVINVELRATGANTDLHSGNWGGIVPNPAWTIVHLLGTMLDANYEVTIDGFYDDVRPVTPLMEAAIARIPLDREAALASVGVRELPPPVGVGSFERLMARPTLTINGLTSGYQGVGSKTVLPATASAKLDMRLVADQRADDIFTKVKRHVEQYAPGVEVIFHGSMEPSATPLDHPYAGAVRRAVARGFGGEPLDLPALGGSLPDAVWTRTLGLPSVLVPYCNSDERNHAPNENMEVARFHAGIRTAASLLAELA
ncbi:MAG: M20/M25/M40 family metallo-hydrolase [Thermomicrobiales bacterium]|nr:M20/M25/M40 family metallo-hydrolase [Thermomicrobiales bacterium]